MTKGNIANTVSGALYRHLFTTFKAEGLPVNSTADYPRVEIVSVTEGEWQDKGGYLRTATVTVDSMSAASQMEAIELNERVVEAIKDTDTSVPGISEGIGFEIVGVAETSVSMSEDYVETQLQSYRLTLTVKLIIIKNS